jgi:hypothetical protein
MTIHEPIQEPSSSQILNDREKFFTDTPQNAADQEHARKVAAEVAERSRLDMGAFVGRMHANESESGLVETEPATMSHKEIEDAFDQFLRGVLIDKGDRAYEQARDRFIALNASGANGSNRHAAMLQVMTEFTATSQRAEAALLDVPLSAE